MKNYLILLIFLLISIKSFTQTGNVGINTTTPANTLDVNGTSRIRQTPTATALNTARLIISQANGEVWQIDPSVITANLKIPTTILSVRLATPSTTLWAGNDTFHRVVYDTVDINPPASIGTWNSATNTFTANAAGVFQISTGILLSDFSNPDANLAIVTTPYIQSSGGGVLSGSQYSVNHVLSVKLNPGDTVYCELNAGSSDSFYEQSAQMTITYTPL